MNTKEQLAVDAAIMKPFHKSRSFSFLNCHTTKHHCMCTLQVKLQQTGAHLLQRAATESAFNKNMQTNKKKQINTYL